MSYKVTVDAEKCVGDGECVDICPVSVYEMENDKAVVVNDECLGCQSCLEVCPADAITIDEE